MEDEKAELPTSTALSMKQQQMMTATEWSKLVKATIANNLSKCFSLFPTYGKEPEAIKNMHRIFCNVLGDYKIEYINQAFDVILRNGKSFPTPIEVLNALVRDGQPMFDKAVYIEFCKISDRKLDDEQRQYIAEYEHFALTGEIVRIRITPWEELSDREKTERLFGPQSPI